MGGMGTQGQQFASPEEMLEDIKVEDTPTGHSTATVQYTATVHYSIRINYKYLKESHTGVHVRTTVNSNAANTV